MSSRDRRDKKPNPRGSWALREAKARFSEVVRKARTEGPQHVTVRGKQAVVVVSASHYARTAPKGKGLTGAVLVEAMQEARRLGLKLKPMKYYPTYRPPVSFSDEER